MRPILFVIGAAACFCVLFVAAWLLLTRRRRRGPRTATPAELEAAAQCGALAILDPHGTTITFADGLWTAVVRRRDDDVVRYTSHHRGSYQDLWNYDRAWFTDVPEHKPVKAAPSIEAYLNDRRDETIHAQERPAARRRQIVNRPLETLD